MKRFLASSVVLWSLATPCLAGAQPADRPVDAPPSASSTALPSQVKPLAETLTGMAKADYVAGRVLFEDGDAAGALVKFRAAHEASKEPRLLWNLAACEKALHHYARALALVERYQSEASSLLDEGERDEAERIVQALGPLVAKMTVAVDEPGATIAVDDETAGTSPLPGALPVDLGRRRVVVRKPGFKTFDEPVLVTGSSDVRVDVALARDVHEGRVLVRSAANATIKLDGRVVGTGSWEGVVPSGGHALHVSAPGMRVYQTELIVPDGQTRTVEITLESDTKGTLPTWLWIAGGAVVAGGLAAGGYFLVKPGDPVSPEPTPGTLAPGYVVLR